MLNLSREFCRQISWYGKRKIFGETEFFNEIIKIKNYKNLSVFFLLQHEIVYVLFSSYNTVLENCELFVIEKLKFPKPGFSNKKYVNNVPP